MLQSLEAHLQEENLRKSKRFKDSGPKYHLGYDFGDQSFAYFHMEV